MVKAHEQGRPEDLDAQLFVYLSLERRQALLAIFYFAAGKFPQAGECLISDPFGDQHTTVIVTQDACNNPNANLSIPS